MADPQRFQFPLLTDVIRRVQYMLDQPADETGQLTWANPAEFAIEANAAQRSMFDRMKRINEETARREADLDVPTGTTFLSLPDDLASVRQVYQVDANGRYLWRVRDGMWESLDRVPNRAIFIPRRVIGLPAFDGKPGLRFTKATTVPFKIHVIYSYTCLPLFHGVVRDAGRVVIGSLTFAVVQLAEHEMSEEGRYVGQAMFMPEGPTAISTTAVGRVNAFNGRTRSATLSGDLDELPEPGVTVYTSRPDLHPLMEDAYILDLVCRLAAKVQDERRIEWMQQRDEIIQNMQFDLGTLDDQEPLIVRDDSGDTYGDPVRRLYGW